MNKKIKDWGSWVLLNGGVMYAFISGAYYNNETMLNIAIPILWFMGIFGILMLLTAKAVAKELVKEGNIKRTVPLWLDHTYDVVFTLFILGAGYSWLGVLYFLHIYAIRAIHKEVAKLEKGDEDELKEN